MGKTIYSKISVWFMIMLVLSLSVLSLGIRPAKTVLGQEVNLEEGYSGSFWIINTDQQETSLLVYVSGEMADYINLDVEELNFREDEEALEVNFIVTEPIFLPPGESVATIVVEEELGGSSNNVVSSKLILKHKIIFVGEYPEKFVTAKLNFQETEDSFKIVAEVENLGQENIDSVKTTYYVNNQKEILTTLESEEESLDVGENKLLSVNLDKNILEQGEFEILAKVDYDGNVVEVIKKLLYGKPEVEITYFDKYFTSGIINSYTLELLNKWNKKVENVFVDVLVNKKDESGSLEEIDSFRTRSIDISAFTRERIQDYYDAQDKSNGDYVFSMVVNFWNTYKMDQKEFEVTFLGESGTVENIVGMTVVSDSKFKEGENSLGDVSVSLTTLFMVICGVIIIGVVAVFVLFKKKKNDGWE